MPVAFVNSTLSGRIQQAAPDGAVGYVLRREGCPFGKGNFVFPVPYRKTKHADGTLRNTSVYQLSPFEPPRIPWTGVYELLFLVPEIGMVTSADLDRHTIHLSQFDIVPRAAFDEHALWEWIPLGDGTDTGNAESVMRQVLACAPANAVGYCLRTSNAPTGPGTFVFPPRERVSRRSDGGISNIPYYALKPFELPCVPWAGMYSIAFELEHRIAWLNPDPGLQQIHVGIIFPYADREASSHVTQTSMQLQQSNQRPLLIGGSVEPRRVRRRRQPAAR